MHVRQYKRFRDLVMITKGCKLPRITHTVGTSVKGTLHLVSNAQLLTVIWEFGHSSKSPELGGKNPRRCLPLCWHIGCFNPYGHCRAWLPWVCNVAKCGNALRESTTVRSYLHLPYLSWLYSNFHLWKWWDLSQCLVGKVGTYPKLLFLKRLGLILSKVLGLTLNNHSI